MELKWLEDLLSVATHGHFARAAEERHVTQSALSRRIKALEFWAGVELLDRSRHPIVLTPAGEEFCEVARDIVKNAYEARTTAQQYEKRADNSITIACLHTLALFYVPNMVKKLSNEIGKFQVSIVAETRTIDEYLEGLSSGASDLFLCYSHSADSINYKKAGLERMKLGIDHMRPYHHRKFGKINLDEDSSEDIPFLQYSGTAYMSRVVESIVAKSPFKSRLQSVYRASLAESLFVAAQQGLGLAWLPDSIVKGNSLSRGLIQCSDQWVEPMTVVMFRSTLNHRPIVDKIWDMLNQANH